jgi:hypothetical protein
MGSRCTQTPRACQRLRGARLVELRPHALWFDIAKTMVSLYEPDRGRFVALDEAEIARLMSLKKPV